MKKYVYNDISYELKKNYKEGFEEETVKNLVTDYFNNYDYIVGDWSYGKMRLKGFCDKGNALYNDINDIKKLDEYIKNNCSYECKYFVLKKID